MPFSNSIETACLAGITIAVIITAAILAPALAAKANMACFESDDPAVMAKWILDWSDHTSSS